MFKKVLSAGLLLAFAVVGAFAQEAQVRNLAGG